MRSYLRSDTFFSKMRKKPALQNILDNLLSYSIEDLENMKSQPLWIRNELIELRKRDGLSKDQIAIKIASLMSPTDIEDKREYPTLEVREWTGPDVFWSSLNSRLEMQISTGNLLFLDPLNFEVKIDYTLMKLDSKKWDIMILNSKFIDFMDNYTYCGLIQQRLSKKHG